MFNHTMTSMTDKPWRVALATAFALALAGAPARAQDGDDDGVLPKQGAGGGTSSNTDGSSSSSASGSLGLSGTPGADTLDPAKASLVFTADQGTLMVDTAAAPEAATFVASGSFDFTIGDTSAEVQGHGQLLPQPGLTAQLLAAPDALGRVALLVVHDAQADLAALLSGAQAPGLVLSVGDLPVLDLAKAQNSVSHYEAQLPGLAVSVVFLSVDADGQVHASGARLDPAGGPIEIAID